MGALVRLTGQSSADSPQTDAEREAFSLAERASKAARRGDYHGAWALLDQAVTVASDSALVDQYRTHVACLRGDPEVAVQALERALELEPDNELFRRNLLRLRR